MSIDLALHSPPFQRHFNQCAPHACALCWRASKLSIWAWRQFEAEPFKILGARDSVSRVRLGTRAHAAHDHTRPEPSAPGAGEQSPWVARDTRGPVSMYDRTAHVGSRAAPARTDLDGPSDGRTGRPKMCPATKLVPICPNPTTGTPNTCAERAAALGGHGAGARDTWRTLGGHLEDTWGTLG